MIELLQKLGFSRNQSNALSILLDGEWHTSREIEKTAEMRQPEVCVTLKTLSEYIEFKRLCIDGKCGAPVKPMRLKSKEEFIKRLECENTARYTEKQNAIDELRDLTAAHKQDDDCT